MAWSSLATVQIWSPNNSGARNHTIDSVAIHTMAGNLSAEGCGQWFANSYAQASSNYGIDSSGVIGVYVDESDRAWCTSSGGVDNRAVTIEVASVTDSEPYECTPQAYEALIRLLVDICQRNNIPSLRWKNDMNCGLAAAAGGSVEEQNMFVHRWFNTDKSCPGEYLFSRQGQIATEVNTRLGNGEVYTDAGSGTSAISPQTININYEEFNPYIVTLSRYSTPNYDSFKDGKICAALIEAGMVFAGNHSMFSKFENPLLGIQVNKIKELNLPFGLYTSCQARNINEARIEMYQFSFPVRRYPPQIGVWLKLEFNNNTATNNLILEYYKKELIMLGYKYKMGIICTRDMLQKIDWDTFQNDYFLWLVDHVNSQDAINKLLDPEFFDTDGKG